MTHALIHAAIVIATLTAACAIFHAYARHTDRRNRAWLAAVAEQSRRDAAHAVDLAAAHTSLGTLLPGPSETPVHDRCAAIYGVVPEVPMAGWEREMLEAEWVEGNGS